MKLTSSWKPSIQKYMRQARAPRAPSQNWSTLLRHHVMQIWACDFLPPVDLLFWQVFLFFVLQVGSRRVVHFGMTRTPTAAWVAQPLREATPCGQGPQHLIRDRDPRYGTLFAVVARASGIEVLKTRIARLVPMPSVSAFSEGCDGNVWITGSSRAKGNCIGSSKNMWLSLTQRGHIRASIRRSVSGRPRARGKAEG
jgi:hypothetical protein